MSSSLSLGLFNQTQTNLTLPIRAAPRSRDTDEHLLASGHIEGDRFVGAGPLQVLIRLRGCLLMYQPIYTSNVRATLLSAIGRRLPINIPAVFGVWRTSRRGRRPVSRCCPRSSCRCRWRALPSAAHRYSWLRKAGNDIHAAPIGTLPGRCPAGAPGPILPGFRQRHHQAPSPGRAHAVTIGRPAAPVRRLHPPCGRSRSPVPCTVTVSTPARQAAN